MINEIDFNEKTNKLYFYSIFIVLISLIFICTLFKVKYQTFYKTYAIVEKSGNDYIVSVITNSKDIEYITKDNKVYINGKKLSYYIDSIDENLYIDEQGINYKKYY
ncbi:MAG: hypothetical protein ACK5HL_02810 [Bacilli bacterium]